MSGRPGSGRSPLINAIRLRFGLAVIGDGQDHAAGRFAQPRDVEHGVALHARFGGAPTPGMETMRSYRLFGALTAVANTSAKA